MMKTHSKYLNWLLGLAVIVGLLLFLTVFTLPSLLEWQSSFLSRCFFVLIVCFAFCLLRLLLGPTAADRAVAVDTLGILIVGFCAILSIPTGRSWYIDIAIAWALQSFIGALALAKYLEGKGFDE
ncbi:MAG: cation:proton antiporter [Candidatus Omnitrophota bacterium]|nr:cation:proton antiporter [Candidatus Omnitrophota bacterium]